MLNLLGRSEETDKKINHLFNEHFSESVFAKEVRAAMRQAYGHGYMDAWEEMENKALAIAKIKIEKESGDGV